MKMYLVKISVRGGEGSIVVEVKARDPWKARILAAAYVRENINCAVAQEKINE